MKLEFLFSALFLIAGVPSTMAADCGPLTMVNSVDIVLGPNRALVPVSINGTTELLILDTGGYTSSLSKKVIDDLNLPVRESRTKLLDLYGNASTKMVRVEELIVGHQKGHDINFAIEPDPTFGERARFVGIFGPNLLGKYDVEMDFAGKKLNFFSPDHCPGHVVYWQPTGLAVVPFEFRNMHIRLPVNLDGHQLNAEIDTGSPNTNITAEAVKRVFDIDASSPGSVVLQSQSMPGAFDHVFATLDFQGVAVKNAHVLVRPDLIGSKDPNNGMATDSHVRKADSPDNFYSTAPPDILVGMDILKKLRVYVAFDERKIYISPSTAAPSEGVTDAPAIAKQSTN